VAVSLMPQRVVVI